MNVNLAGAFVIPMLVLSCCLAALTSCSSHQAAAKQVLSIAEILSSLTNALSDPRIAPGISRIAELLYQYYENAGGWPTNSSEVFRFAHVIGASEVNTNVYRQLMVTPQATGALAVEYVASLEQKVKMTLPIKKR